jgi:hypothetical protein
MQGYQKDYQIGVQCRQKHPYTEKYRQRHPYTEKYRQRHPYTEKYRQRHPYTYAIKNQDIEQRITIQGGGGDNKLMF